MWFRLLTRSYLKFSHGAESIFVFLFFPSECAEVAAITDYAASDARGDDTACTESTETSEATACRFCVACASGGTLTGREELGDASISYCQSNMECVR